MVAMRVMAMATARMWRMNTCYRGGDGAGAPAPPRLGSLQREHHDRAGVLRHALERLAEERSELVTHQRSPAGGHRDVLLALGRVADDAAVVADAVVVRPELLPRLGVIRAEHTARV